MVFEIIKNKYFKSIFAIYFILLFRVEIAGILNAKILVDALGPALSYMEYFVIIFMLYGSFKLLKEFSYPGDLINEISLLKLFGLVLFCNIVFSLILFSLFGIVAALVMGIFSEDPTSGFSLVSAILLCSFGIFLSLFYFTGLSIVFGSRSLDYIFSKTKELISDYRCYKYLAIFTVAQSFFLFTTTLSFDEDDYIKRIAFFLAVFVHFVTFLALVRFWQRNYLSVQSVK
ncbi:hypothetical protein [Leptospira koniambonensis]|uniref:hypothetical protein n=1 Tax=Leptospira koniambonensis TaxID=2484950 RepID=UPI003EBD2CA1